MSEEIRYYSRLGDFEQEINIPISQFSNEELKEFTSLFLTFLKRDLALENKEKGEK